MRIFLDTANIEHIRQAAKLGVIDGITTNPTLVSKEGRADYKAVIQEICSIVSGPVSVEVLSREAPQMIAQAQEYSSWAPNVVIKIPMSPAGLEAILVLTGQGRSQVPLLAANGLDDVPVFNDLLEAAVWILKQEGVPLRSQGLSMRAPVS